MHCVVVVVDSFKAQESAEFSTTHWVVFDGPLEWKWLHFVQTALMDDDPFITLGNGDQILIVWHSGFFQMT